MKNLGTPNRAGEGLAWKGVRCRACEEFIGRQWAVWAIWDDRKAWKVWFCDWECHESVLEGDSDGDDDDDDEEEEDDSDEDENEEDESEDDDSDSSEESYYASGSDVYESDSS